jgi:hypothetical protein
MWSDLFSIERIEAMLTKIHHYYIQVSQDLSTCTSDPYHRGTRRTFQDPSESIAECDQGRRSEGSWGSNGFSGIRIALISVDIAPNTLHDAARQFQPRMDYESSHAVNRGCY